MLENRKMGSRMSVTARTLFAALLIISSAGVSAAADNLGPYNLTFLEGGIGLTRPLAADNAALAPNSPWSLTTWLLAGTEQPGDLIVAAIGGVATESCRCLDLHDGKLQLRAGGVRITATNPVHAGVWQAVAATYDGESLRLFVDGVLVGSQQPDRPTRAVDPVLRLAP